MNESGCCEQGRCHAPWLWNSDLCISTRHPRESPKRSLRNAVALSHRRLPCDLRRSRPCEDSPRSPDRSPQRDLSLTESVWPLEFLILHNTSMIVEVENGVRLRQSQQSSQKLCLTSAVSASAPEAETLPASTPSFAPPSKLPSSNTNGKSSASPTASTASSGREVVRTHARRVSGILPRGGTILGTTNRGNPFQYKTEENGEEVVARHLRPESSRMPQLWASTPSSPSAAMARRKSVNELFQKGMQDRRRAKDHRQRSLRHRSHFRLRHRAAHRHRCHRQDSHHRRVAPSRHGRRGHGARLLAGSRWKPASPAALTSFSSPKFRSPSRTFASIAMRERGKHFTIVVVAEGMRLPHESKQMARGSACRQHLSAMPSAPFQQGSPRQRARGHSARRLAFALRPRAGYALRRSRRRSDCRESFGKMVGAARRFDCRGRHGPAHRPTENRDPKGK